MTESNIYTEEGLAELAREVASELAGHENIFLSGELGAGKTTFVQKLLTALGSQDAAGSPTFQLVNEYRLSGGRRLVHIDLYRLTNPDDAILLGISEYLNDQKTLCLVEWPERGEQLLPVPHQHLHFTHRTPTTRRVARHRHGR